ncbi:hypothetical protein MTR_2g059130 [Medicago truncatula]|uniref:Uncharacterized protein n=1 Tax=Medicago truncatula TaxID=3880 RepID=G7IT06_MEDTR|nr:hypothetical protein MTR_2g059130 [Medicago truncatula]
MCEECYEDVSHVLFDYPRARKVWQDGLLLSKVNSVMLWNNTAAEFIFALLQETSHTQAEDIAIHGRLKCNIDATFSKALNCVGFGFCIRNEFGEFIRARTMWSNPVVRRMLEKLCDFHTPSVGCMNYNLLMLIFNWMH